MMILRSTNVVSVSLALLLAFFGSSAKDQLADATSDVLGGLLGGVAGATNALTGAAVNSLGSHLNSLGSLGSGVASAANPLTGTAVNSLGSHLNPLGSLGSGVAGAANALTGAAVNSLGSHLNSLGSLGSGVASAANPLTGTAVNSLGSHLNPLGSLGSGLAGAANALTGAAVNSMGSHLNPLGSLGSGMAGMANTMTGSLAKATAASRMGAQPMLSGGLGSGLANAASSMAGLGSASQMAAASSAATGSGLGGALLGAASSGSLGAGGILGGGLNIVKGMTGALTSGLATSMGDAYGHFGLNPANPGASLASAGSFNALPGLSFGHEGPASSAAALEASSAASSAAHASAAAAGSSAATSGMLAGASPLMAAAVPMEFEAAHAASTMGHALTSPNAMAAAANRAALAATAASSPPVGARTDIALDAMRQAQNEAALAGSEMVVDGSNNARSASMASNAYRNAKLASARDRVNIAGTIQNAARTSDATIATHDAATKAEDSLLGSELAVDSAATVLDSDGAYIPPVTSSLLRSLPYGRLGLRNILPKPLAHSSQNLPDVWLNGFPVRYSNVPLRFYPPLMFGYGPVNAAASVYNAAAGGVHFMQPFQSYNGLSLNGMVFDPAYAYLSTNLEGVLGTSAWPILVNGQLEAQDEVAMANLLQMQQLNGVGMSTTYQGYGRLNPVPMITGSVTDANLMPTTTIGTTYPIGSALVIEPRDSFFQDYNDNASSRQNMDERQQ